MGQNLPSEYQTYNLYTAPIQKHPSYKPHALSASNGPPGASLIKKKVKLATAINTGIANNNLLIKMFNTKF